jgi:hypothetical protein
MLNNHFQEFLNGLESHGARYLLVGGYAVARHGHPRYTNDLDIFVEPGEQNADRVVATFADFGFPNTVVREDFLEPNRNVAIGQEPLRLHIITGIPGVTFEECYGRRVFLDGGQHKYPVIGLDDLIRNKEATGRTIDKQDLIELRKSRERQGGNEKER